MCQKVQRGPVTAPGHSTHCRPEARSPSTTDGAILTQGQGCGHHLLSLYQAGCPQPSFSGLPLPGGFPGCLPRLLLQHEHLCIVVSLCAPQGMEPLSAASVHLARLIFLMAVKSVGHRAGMDEGLEGWSGWGLDLQGSRHRLLLEGRGWGSQRVQGLPWVPASSWGSVGSPWCSNQTKHLTCPDPF